MDHAEARIASRREDTSIIVAMVERFAAEHKLSSADDVRPTYDGDLPEFTERRPTEDGILDGEDGAHLLAGFMLRRNADRVCSESRDGRPVVRFSFDH